MNNKIKYFACVMVAVMATVTSYATTAADYTDIVYAKDVKAAVGGTIELPIYLKNPSYGVKSLQFSMKLPEDVCFVEVESGHKTTKNDLTQDWTITFKTKEGEEENTGLAMLSYQNNATMKIEQGSDVEVFTVTLQIAEDAILGSREIVMNNITLTDDNGAEKTILKGEQAISSTINIQPYDEGYSIRMTPFAFNEDVDGLEFVLGTLNELTKVSFEVEFPENIGTNQLYTVSKALGTTVATTKFIDDEAGNVSVSIARKSTKTIADSAIVAKLELGYDGGVLEAGVYELKIKNIKMTDADGNEYNAAPYTTNIYIGEAKAQVVDGKVTISGDYSGEEAAALFSAAIPTEDATVTTLDLSGVTALPENTEILLANPNALICTKTDLGLANTRNVVIGNVCAELSLTGDGNFSFPKEFTATQASCTRTLPNTYGTVCLPYEVQAAEGYAFYTLEKVEGGVMYFNSVKTLPAGTPAMIQAKHTGENTTLSASDVTVNPNASRTADTGLEGWKMEGTFTGKTINVEEDKDHSYFFIGSNQYHQATNTLTVNPFRAYFVAENTTEVKNYQINIGEETGVKTLLFNAAEIAGVYDVTGKLRSGIAKGLNMLKMKDGSVRKIMVK